MSANDYGGSSTEQINHFEFDNGVLRELTKDTWELELCKIHVFISYALLQIESEHCGYQRVDYAYKMVQLRPALIDSKFIFIYLIVMKSSWFRPCLGVGVARSGLSQNGRHGTFEDLVSTASWWGRVLYIRGGQLLIALTKIAITGRQGAL